jgi:hypothetical protein
MASFRLHRTERDDAFKHGRLFESPQYFSVFPARSLDVELKTDMFRRDCDLGVLHHGMNAFQNAVDLRADDVGTAAAHFVGMYRQLQIEPLFRVAQQEKAKQNQSGGKDRGEIQSSTNCHAYGGDHKQSGRRGDACDQVAATVQNGAGSDKADARNDLCRDAGVVSEVLDRQRIRKQCEHCRTEADKEVRAQPGGPVFELALQSDGASQDRRQYESQQGNSSRRHLKLQNVPDMLHDRHGEVSGWILSPENLRLLASVAGKVTQVITGQVGQRAEGASGKR